MTFTPQGAHDKHGTERDRASSETIMNVLLLIKQQLEKAARLRNAQMAHLTYRGVPYQH